MKIEEKNIRTQKIVLNEKEFLRAIVEYLKKEGVPDTEQHVTINPIDTRSDDGIILEVTIKNYNP